MVRRNTLIDAALALLRGLNMSDRLDSGEELPSAKVVSFNDAAEAKLRRDVAEIEADPDYKAALREVADCIGHNRPDKVKGDVQGLKDDPNTPKP
jgi:hypothetical protein